MVETGRSCKELKPALKGSLENLLQWLERGEYPPAEVCQSGRLLLLEYVASLHRHIPDFAEKHGIRVSVCDSSGEKPTAEEICDIIKLHPEMLSILYQLGIRKILDGNNPRILLPEWQFLLEQRYIAPVCLENTEEKWEYYTLSSKGWSCLNRKSIQKTLRKQVGENFLSVPEKLLPGPEGLDSLNIIRAAMLEAFYTGSGDDYLSFLYPDGQGLLLGTEISGAAGVRYVCPGIFDGEPTECQIGLMQELILSAEVENVTFLILSDENQTSLNQALGCPGTEKVHFYMMEAPDGRKH